MNFKDFVDASVGQANDGRLKFDIEGVKNLYKSRVADFFNQVEND